MRNLMKTEFLVPIILMLLTACASTPVTPLPPDANPFTELERLKQEVQDGREHHLDVLSGQSFRKALIAENRAADLIAEGRNPEPILADLARGFHFLRQARANAEKNGPYLRGVLVARTDAMQAKAQENPRTAKRFAEADEAVRDDSDNAHKWSIETLREFQGRYRYLELMALTAERMGGSLSQLTQAEHMGAKSISPDTLKRAQVDYLAAEDAISANRKNEEAYGEEVKHATRSSDLLYQVVEALKRSNGNIDEPTAVKLATQDQEIKDLKKTVAELKAQPAPEKVAVVSTEDGALKRVTLQSSPAASVQALDGGAPVAVTPKAAPVAPPLQVKAADKGKVAPPVVVADREELQSGDDNVTGEKVAPPPASPRVVPIAPARVTEQKLETPLVAEPTPRPAIQTEDLQAVNPPPRAETRGGFVAPVAIPVSAYHSPESQKRRADIDAERQKLRERELALEKDSPLDTPARNEALSAAATSPESRKARTELEAERRKLKERELSLEAAPVANPAASKRDEVTLQSGTTASASAPVVVPVPVVENEKSQRLVAKGERLERPSAAGERPQSPLEPIQRAVAGNEKPRIDFELERQKLDQKEHEMAREENRRDTAVRQDMRVQRYTDNSPLANRPPALIPLPIVVPVSRDERNTNRDFEAQRRALDQREANMRREEDKALSKGRGSYSPQFEKERLALERRERELQRDQSRSLELNREEEVRQENFTRKDMRAREKRIDGRNPLGSCSFQKEEICGNRQARPLTRQVPRYKPGWKVDGGNLIARSTPITE